MKKDGWKQVACCTGLALSLLGGAARTSQAEETILTQAAQKAVSTLKVSGYIQGKYLINEDNNVDPNNEFKLFRARIKIAGKVRENIDYKIMFGAYEPPPSAIAQPGFVDMYMDFKVSPYAAIKVGQYFLPFGLEAPMPITTHPAIERSNVTSEQNDHAIFRDIGIELHGTVGIISYQVAVVNGYGAARNDKDNLLLNENNEKKDFVSSVQISPYKYLNLGISGYRGWYDEAELDRHKYAAFMYGTYSDFSYMAEYITKIDEQAAPGGDIRSQGAYLLVAYKITPVWQPLVRVESYDPDMGADHDILKILTVGVNYIPWEKVRFAVNYEFKDDDRTDVGTNLFQLLTQVSF